MGKFAETAIVDHCLSFADQGKQTSVRFPFLFAANKRICHFFLPFAVTKRKLPLSVSFVFRLRNSRNVKTWAWRYRNVETWKHGDMRHGDMETWRHGDMDAWGHRDIKRHGDMEKWRHADMQIWRHGDIDTRAWIHQTENRKRKPIQFSLIRLRFAYCANGNLSFVRLLTKKQMEAIFL